MTPKENIIKQAFLYFLRVTIRVASWNWNTTPNISGTSQFTPNSARGTRRLNCRCRRYVFTKATHWITFNLIINIFSKVGAFWGNCVTAIILGRRSVLWSSMICTIFTIQITGKCSITTDSKVIITSHVDWTEQGFVISASFMELSMCSSTLIITSTVAGINKNSIIDILFKVLLGFI